MLVMKISKKYYGWSLLELMIALSLVTIISLAGLPSLSASINRSQAQKASENIIKAFDLARQEAITRNHVVTLCGVINNKCEARGKLTLSIFIDNNENKIIDSDEEIIRVISKIGNESELLIRASLGRNYFRFKENGTSMESGSIIYCPSDKVTEKQNYAQIVKLNYTGRAYLMNDGSEKEKQTACL